jgi:hypothetical protein
MTVPVTGRSRCSNLGELGVVHGWPSTWKSCCENLPCDLSPTCLLRAYTPCRDQHRCDHHPVVEGVGPEPIQMDHMHTPVQNQIMLIQNLDAQIPNPKPPQLVIHPVTTSPGTPTQGNLPTPTPAAVEPTPKASAGFSVPSARFMPKIKLGGNKKTTLASLWLPLLQLLLLQLSMLKVSWYLLHPSGINLSEIGVRDRDQFPFRLLLYIYNAEVLPARF